MVCIKAYLRTLPIARTLSNYRMIMNVNQLERVRKETAVTYLRYPGICLERLERTTKNSVRLAGLRAEIWTRDLPKTMQECYPMPRSSVFLNSGKIIQEKFLESKAFEILREDKVLHHLIFRTWRCCKYFCSWKVLLIANSNSSRSASIDMACTFKMPINLLKMSFGVQWLASHLNSAICFFNYEILSSARNTGRLPTTYFEGHSSTLSWLMTGRFQFLNEIWNYRSYQYESDI
jgi:hypothetical protein